MTTAPGPPPDRIDPAHVLAVSMEAIPGPVRDEVQFAQGRPGTVVYLPTRHVARAAQDALTLVGYRVDASDRGCSLFIRDWSTGALEARLVGMRAVLSLLSAQPGRTAATMLDQLRAVPAAQLAAAGTRRRLAAQAGQQLRRWLDARSGIHAPHDPRFQPTDPGDATRLLAAWRLEKAIDDIAARQQRVAAEALGLYPALRTDLGHAMARDTAVQQASITFHLTPRPEPHAAREFPGPGRPVLPATRPPASGPAGPRGRNFPSGRAGRLP
jgi:hypothetical protein